MLEITGPTTEVKAPRAVKPLPKRKGSTSNPAPAPNPTPAPVPVAGPSTTASRPTRSTRSSNTGPAARASFGNPTGSSTPGKPAKTTGKSGKFVLACESCSSSCRNVLTMVRCQQTLMFPLQ